MELFKIKFVITHKMQINWRGHARINNNFKANSDQK